MTTENFVDSRVGKQIRAQRLAAGVSTDAVAEALEVPIAQIDEWEAGKSRIPPLRLLAIAKFIGSNAAVFFEGLDSPGASSESSKPTDEAELHSRIR